ncbi:unnamed protein product [Clonostachys solani]|uniref:Glucose-methanol-choline oxidoreductase N-terminal domain-containing protein n=1 Tax=Clonostachys solani TaxID=160281 RepID=A0A9N9ZA14_9HYPO|nr:unnamed protein product [Clonostachys solani]
MGFLAGALTGLLYLAPLVAGAIIPPDAIDSLHSSYDYVIVGGGPSGLVLANRLSEQKCCKVLVLEAGGLDDGRWQVQAPGSIGLEDVSMYDWNWRTVPQTFLNNADRSFPLGKAVGGGSVVNGMVWTRASASDYDSWVDLGNDGWGWDDLLPYFKKSESFSPDVNDYGRDNLQIDPDSEIHGRNGPIQVGYPRHFYHPQTQNFLDGVEELGITIVGEPNEGNMTGASVVPSSLTHDTNARCSARAGYLTPIVDRPNLHVAFGQRVTRVLFDNSSGDPKAVGVEFATDSAATVRNITAKREVILSAGAVHTPTLLQISGIGPRRHLESLGVDVLVDLPGVGNNFQDHPMISPDTVPGLYTSRNLTGAEGAARLKEWQEEHTGPYTTPLIHAVAFPGFPSVAPDYADRLNAIRNGSIANSLPDSYDETLRAGYEAQLTSIIGLLEKDDVSAYELMSNSFGGLTVSVMQPLSRGNVSATSKSVWDAPKIDPRYCSHAFDCDMVEIGLRFNDRLIATKSMAELQPVPQAGFGPDVTHEELQRSLRASLHSDYHPSCTASMLSRDLGGAVDTSLRVYGTKGLRVVDASIFPTIPGAHLQAAVYAVAEKAADVIKGDGLHLHERRVL